MFGYKKLPALAQVLLVLGEMNRIRWEWIFTGKVGGVDGQVYNRGRGV